MQIMCSKGAILFWKHSLISQSTAVTPFSPLKCYTVTGWHPNLLCATCGESGKNVGRVDFQFITPLDGNMTALVINGTQVEGGGGYFLGKCNTGCYQISRGTE